MKDETVILIFFTCLIACAIAQPTLPTLPNDFSVSIEVNILEKNYTTRRNEYYDYDNNRVRFDIYTQNQTYVEIFDFSKGTRHEIIDWEDCNVYPINYNRTFNIVDGNHHLINGSAFFAFGAQFDEIYQGVQPVRGILCDSWITSVNFSLSDGGVYNFTLQYFFSVDNWQIFEGNTEQRIPIRAEIEGTRTYVNGTEHWFHHIYDYVFFQVGQPHDWWFELPEGYRCGSLDNFTLPELPNNFETGITFTDRIGNFTGDIFEAYDYDNNRVRVSFTMDGKTYTEIIRGDLGYRYEIIDRYDCTIYGLNYTGFLFENSTNHLKSASGLFHFGEAYNETYEGVRTVRGIPCDYWIDDVTFVSQSGVTYSLTVGYYFSVDSWTMGATSQHRIPVRGERFGTRTFPNGTVEQIDEIYDFFSFIPGVPSADHFNTPRYTSCNSNIQIPLPSVPNDFYVILEITDHWANTTAIVTEYYDYDLNRARYEFHYQNHSYISIQLLDQNIMYMVIDEFNCTRVPFNASLYGPTGHLLSAADLFQFGPQYNESYQGVRYARNIPCDYWTAQLVGTSYDPVTTYQYNYTAWYYFSRAEWEMVNDHLDYRIPVLIEIQGEITANGVTRLFHNSYNFIHFNPEQPDDDVWYPDHDWQCNLRDVFKVYIVFDLKIPQYSFNPQTFINNVARQLRSDVGQIKILSISDETVVLVEVATSDVQTTAQAINASLDYWGNLYPLNSVYYSEKLRCNSNCNHNGYCHFGKCLCNEGYSGVACENALQEPATLGYEMSK